MQNDKSSVNRPKFPVDLLGDIQNKLNNNFQSKDSKADPSFEDLKKLILEGDLKKINALIFKDPDLLIKLLKMI
jgi:hypothetical protein